MSTEYNFTVERKGYNTEEVDAVVDDLTAKNTYLKGRVNELETKLDAARRLIRRFSDSENGLRQSIADSKRAAAEMLEDTKERSDTLLDKARESCGEMISDLDMKIADRMNTVDVIRSEVASFKDQLFRLYSSHIDMIESIAATAENFVYEPDYSKIAEAVDEFEEGEEMNAQLPEFEEYPQESIFKDFEEQENKDFVMGDENQNTQIEEKENAQPEFEMKTEEKPDETAEEDAGENEFFSAQEPTVTEEKKDGEFSFSNDGTDEDFFMTSQPAEETTDAEEADGTEGQSSEIEDDYYKFLADFINEDNNSEN